MKKHRITPIYEKLSNAEKAILAFNASLNDDLEAMKLICDSIPKKTYSQLDAEYTDRLEYFHHIVSALNAEYWKNRYLTLLWISRGKAAMIEGKPDSVKKFIDQHRLSKNYLIALQHVAEAFADQYHLDKKRVCEMIGFDTEDKEITQLSELTEAACKYYDAMLDLISACLEKRDTNDTTKKYLAMN